MDLKESSYVSTAWFIEAENPSRVIGKINELIRIINHDTTDISRFVKDIKMIFNSEGELKSAYVIEGALLSSKPNLESV